MALTAALLGSLFSNDEAKQQRRGDPAPGPTYQLEEQGFKFILRVPKGDNEFNKGKTTSNTPKNFNQAITAFLKRVGLEGTISEDKFFTSYELPNTYDNVEIKQNVMKALGIYAGEGKSTDDPEGQRFITFRDRSNDPGRQQQ